MNNNNHTRNKLFLFVLLLSGIFFVSCSSGKMESIVIENGSFRYEIGHEGKNLHFTDKTTGNDYLDPQSVSYCAYITQDGKQHNITSVLLKGKHLLFEFANADVTADVLVRRANDRINLKVTSVTGAAESLTFLNIPLKLEGIPYEPFAACALSMNLFTHVRELPALQTHLWATCYKRFGLEGAEITLLGVPQQKILSVIRDVMSLAKDVPHSDKGGAWAQMQKEGYGSYLMQFGALTEGTVPEWIEKGNKCTGASDCNQRR